MNIRQAFSLLALAAGAAITSGCAAYRVDSNVEAGPTSTASPTAHVIITEGTISDRKFEVLGPIEVSVKKLTVFHANPTKEQARYALIQRARALGADAVINVTYQSGVGLTTWGYMDAKGTAVKFTE